MPDVIPTEKHSVGTRLRSHCRNGKDNDSLLTLWLETPADAEANCALVQLLEQKALPVITEIVRGKFGALRHGADAEDITSEARFRLLRHLQRLRVETLSGAQPPCIDLPAYVATITYSVWASHLRRRYPARALLLNRLRYLLENRAGPQGFALWHDRTGVQTAGFSVWRDEGRVVGQTPRQQWLLVDARAAASDAFGTANSVPTDLAILVAGLFVWLDGPLELSTLTRVLSEILGLGNSVASPPHEIEEVENSLPDPGFSPHETLRWKEHLCWLWQQVSGLPLGQRTAFLCHSSLLREMELSGLTSIRHTAALLEISPERMAEIWSRLPLNDLEIATLLGSANRQQVINLRKAARVLLGNAWQTVLENN